MTRRRIIEAAGRRFKTDGIDGSGIAALMADAGLTNGAFYAHFESKDALADRQLVDAVPEQGIQSALTLLDRRSALERASTPARVTVEITNII